MIQVAEWEHVRTRDFTEQQRRLVRGGNAYPTSLRATRTLAEVAGELCCDTASGKLVTGRSRVGKRLLQHSRKDALDARAPVRHAPLTMRWISLNARDAFSSRMCA